MNNFDIQNNLAFFKKHETIIDEEMRNNGVEGEITNKDRHMYTANNKQWQEVSYIEGVNL